MIALGTTRLRLSLHAPDVNATAATPAEPCRAGVHKRRGTEYRFGSDVAPVVVRRSCDGTIRAIDHAH